MTRRLAVVRVTAEMMVDLCKEGPARFARIVAHPLPADAEFVRAGHDVTGELKIVVSSASFPEVPEGGAVPELPPTMFEVVQ